MNKTCIFIGDAKIKNKPLIEGSLNSEIKNLLLDDFTNIVIVLPGDFGMLVTSVIAHLPPLYSDFKIEFLLADKDEQSIRDHIKTCDKCIFYFNGHDETCKRLHRYAKSQKSLNQINCLY